MHSAICRVFLAALSVAAVTWTAPGQSEGELGPAGPPDTAERITPPATPPGRNGPGQGRPAKEFPEFKDVAKDYQKVVSTPDGRSFYNIWTRAKDGQMLAELSRNYEGQRIFIAYTVAGGIATAGEQVGDMYAYWKRYDKRLALMQPNLSVRTTGDLESKKAHGRVFTDRVILDVPILCMGPGGGPVIDMDALLVGRASLFFGYRATGVQRNLCKIAKAKAFPNNVELAFEVPLAGGRLGTLHYSISALPENTGYKPRPADLRIGYFTTAFRDIGDPSVETPWVRYITRWKLEKADPKLKLSPPREPIIFYLEHTIPVRYRRWLRDAVLEWNKAFEKIGIANAIEVYQQDARTGAHMEKDPEDVRYNFVIWTNAQTGYAIGPSRVHPATGQILDADISIPEEFVTGWSQSWERFWAEAAIENFGPETRAWLARHPQWDPRVCLADPSKREAVAAQITLHHQQHQMDPGYGHPAAVGDPTLLGDDLYDGLTGRISQVNGACRRAALGSTEIAFYRLADEILQDLARGDDNDDDDEGEEDVGVDDDEEEGDDDADDEEDEDEDAEDEDEDEDAEDEDEQREPEIDGVPESFLGPMLKDLLMHEFGHILGLRHNFKASSVYPLEQVNSDEFKGVKPFCGSVMEYLPLNINADEDRIQGDYAMITLGPYDYWAIEYGYTFEKDLKPILARVSEPELTYATDEDSWGPDPRARTFDFGADPLNYADSQIALVNRLRGEILTRLVKKGDSWAKARRHYDYLLGRHFTALAIAGDFLGGANVNRDHKGDPGDRDPVTPTPVDQQRRALEFVIDHAFNDEAFGLTPELLAKMTVDKWWDAGGFGEIFADPAWPIHDRIGGVQSAALTMLLNPGTLNRVYDNELRISPDEDTLTLPEILDAVAEAVFAELEDSPDQNTTARKPMISSLRRNLQRQCIERLIDLSMPTGGYGPSARPMSDLSTARLRELSKDFNRLLSRGRSRIDPYTLAHISESKELIDRALDAQYIYNTDDLSPGGFPFPFFLQPTETTPADDR
ncbi:MAG: zinc-dependent metalloprotease [Phycisphaerales bacterium]|nr:MAG: zinc-dependent metalloprotease [Phycisphaerales bacterium]